MKTRIETGEEYETEEELQAQELWEELMYDMRQEEEFFKKEA